MRKLLLPILVLAFSACNQNQITTPFMPSNPRGLVEINFSEINDLHPSSSAKNISLHRQNRNLSDNSGGIDMKLQSTDAFTFNAGANRQDGFRYLSATFKIRNADSTGTLYGTRRNNLSFVAISTPSTIGGSAISRLLKFDGTPADPSIAPLIRPTHEMTLDKFAFVPVTRTGGEDFQAFSEAEIAKFQPGGLNALTGVTSVFGYGFVTRTIGETTNRMMPAAPFRLDEYDGVVTFAVRVPLQPNPNGASKDPFSFSMVFEVMDDDQTSVTQSLEEQADPINVLARSAMLNNAPIKTLPGSAYTDIPICQIRTAGTVANPLAFMVNSSKLRGIPDFSNQMFVTTGDSVNTDFIQPMNAASQRTFTVNGSMTGLKTGLYTGAGTEFLSFVPSNTSSTAFPPNEEIEVTLTNGLNDLAGVNFCPAHTFKYRTAVTVLSAATFLNRSSIDVGSYPSAVVSSDLNNDGKMDLITANVDSNTVVVNLGNGDGTFQPGLSTGVGYFPGSLVAADFNHDHNIDLVTTNSGSNNITVLLGNGTGGFLSSTNIGFSTLNELDPTSAAVTDLNSDGILDIVTVNSTISGVNTSSISVFLGKGNGNFKASIPKIFSTAHSFTSISTNDLNNDGKMDVIVNEYSDTSPTLIPILLGNGDGSFQEPTFTNVHLRSYAITTGDMNNDTKIDLITAHANNGLSEIGISLGNGDGSFQTPSYNAAGYNPSQVITADLNGDGKLDIASADSDEPGISVLLGNGDGTIQKNYEIPVGTKPNSLTAADLNGDGKLDLTSTNAFLNTVSVLLQ